VRVAFASCFDALGSPQQPVWDRIRHLEPDVLLLLGDSIYMDFFPHLYQSRDWPPEQFADEMYQRYTAQWRVPGFRELLQSVKHVGVVWDDHDFAWNQSHGAGQADKQHVDADRRRISRGLFELFRKSLRSPTQPYAGQPKLEVLLHSTDDGIQEYFDADGVRFIMLDGRTFRTVASAEPLGELHGQEQLMWLKTLVQGAPGICLVASGSTLARSKESWDNYSDYEWFMQQRFPKMLMLSGDIHGNKVRRHKLNSYVLNEATSSGVARSGLGGEHGNFGVLDLNGTQAHLRLFADGDESPETEKTWNL